MIDKILVFIPCYNCETQIVRVLEQFRDQDISRRFDTILVLDNGSTDNTVSAVLKKRSDLNHLPVIVGRNNENYGLGGSHKVAFDYAIENEFTHVVVLHGDDQGSILDLMSEISAGNHNKYDCCLGARFHPSSRIVGYSKFRTFGNRVFNGIFTLAARRRVYDLGAGLNIYKTNMLKGRFYLKYSDDLRFNCYLLIGTISRNLTTHFFSISWRESDQVSNVKLFSQSFHTLNIAIGYLFGKNSYLEMEHRQSKRRQYSFISIDKN